MDWPLLVAVLLVWAVLGAVVAVAAYRPLWRRTWAIFNYSGGSSTVAWLLTLVISLAAGVVWPATAVLLHRSKR